MIAATVLASLLMAPSFGSGNEWLNSQPLTTTSLRGKVVLVQFWTFTCINWIRTLPYTRAWADQYKDDGLVVIGVHSPEFRVERDLDNVRRAAKAMRVGYPVVIDNDFAIWQSFDNQYWPALYIIDKEGRIRHQQFGEGGYEESERVIQRLLGINRKFASVDARGVEAAADWEDLRSGENYVGFERTEGFVTPYDARTKLALNHWAVTGDWMVGKQTIVLRKANGGIVYRFHARDLHLVMGSSTGAPVRMRVTIDGRPPGAAHGVDVDAQGNGVVKEPRLYQLVRQPKPVGDRVFEIEFLDAGVEAFSFTFG